MYTKNGKNFWEIASLIQKAVRRADYQRAGYCANELVDQYSQYLWRKLFIISAEDCFGAVTGKIMELYDFSRMNPEMNKTLASMAVIVLCQCRKNKDADYFGCNFMHSEKPASDASINAYCSDAEPAMGTGCLPGFGTGKYSNNGHSLDLLATALRKAIVNHNFAKAGYAANELMEADNDFLWDTLVNVSVLEFDGELTKEIEALYKADSLQKEREKIFPGKAISLLQRGNVHLIILDMQKIQVL